MKSLIARLERATGPDRELDLAVAVAVNYAGMFNPDYGWQWSLWGDEIEGICDGRRVVLDPAQFCPPFSASIDAALTLVPEGWTWQISNRAPKPLAGRAYIHNGELHFASLYAGRNPKYRGEEDTAATPALALCIAALKARL